MILAPETLTDTARRLAYELHAAVTRAGRASFKDGYTIGDARVCLSVRPDDRPVDPSADLPPELRRARRALRDTYRAIRALRGERPADAEVWPSDIVRWLDAAYPDDSPHSVDTVNHATPDLVTLRLVCRTDERGWFVRTAPRLPTQNRQPDRPSEPALQGYRVDMAGAGVRRFLRGSDMIAAKIWVPGEQGDYGVLVTDQATEQIVVVTERTGTMKVPGRSGRLRDTAAVRADLVRVEGARALVRLPGATTVWTRVLGDWQLAGRAEPVPVEVEPTSAA